MRAPPRARPAARRTRKPAGAAGTVAPVARGAAGAAGKGRAPDGHLAAAFASLGFSELTEIQRRASPAIHQKRDVLVVAPTGSGKTECAVVPIFERLGRARAGRARSAGAARTVGALYVTPLRALNRDVLRRVTAYAAAAGLSVEVRHGDTPQRLRRRIAERPPDVLITTPESLVVMLVQERMLAAFAALEWVVIDEVHELLASERGAQLSVSLERLALASGRDIARIGLSATVGNTVDAAKFVAGARRKCRVVRDRSVRRYDVEIRYVQGSAADVASEIASRVEAMRLDSPVLLFANSRGEAEFMASALRDRSGLPIEMHHGSLSRGVREETEESLKAGRRGIVVCTSSLELGLDIGSVELVVHYGSPRQVSKLVQRIGRSRHARRLSARGLVITNSADDEYEARAIMGRVAAGSIEEQRVHDGALDVLAHHMVGLALQLGRAVGVDEALRLARAAFPFRSTTRDELLAVLGLLARSSLVRLDPAAGSFSAAPRSLRYYYENLSTIPDILRFRVIDTAGRRFIGTLDQRFVGEHGEQGSVFVLRGSHWRIVNVDEKSLAVNVEPFRAGGVTVPYWEGESIPVDYETARRVARLRRRARAGEIEMASGGAVALPESDPAPADAGAPLPSDPPPAADAAPGPGGGGPSPPPDAILAESSRADGAVVLHACLGTRINSTLAALLSSMLSATLGQAVEARSDAYRIALVSQARMTRGRLLAVLSDTYDLADAVSASLAGTHNVNWRVWCVCKRFGIVGRRAVYERRAARFLHERYAGTPIVAEALRELFHDKYDLEGAGRVLDSVRAGRTILEWADVEGRFSRLAAPILDHTSGYHASPAGIDKGVMDMIKKRLAGTGHRLVCARCGRWQLACKTSEVPERLACPHCRGRQIAVTFPADLDLPGLVRKRHRGGRLSADERRRLARAWKTSSLIEGFGRTAVVVLSGYGIGADTAARILRDMADDGDGLYRQIYEAERRYVLTRGFWDS